MSRIKESRRYFLLNILVFLHPQEEMGPYINPSRRSPHSDGVHMVVGC